MEVLRGKGYSLPKRTESNPYPQRWRGVFYFVRYWDDMGNTPSFVTNQLTKEIKSLDLLEVTEIHYQEYILFKLNGLIYVPKNN